MTSEELSRSDGAYSPLQTLDRALDVLLTYDEHRTEWGVVELAQRFDLTKSTAHRLLSGLASKGFLRSDPDTRRYTLGPALWHMAAMWERSGGLARIGHEIARELSENTDRTACFCVPIGANVRCISAVNGPMGPVHRYSLVGEVYPAHASATSRAFFAFLEASERELMLYSKPLARFSESTLTNTKELEERFEETHRLGYAFSEGEYDQSTRALAVPVQGGVRAVGSLSVVERKADSGSQPLLEVLPHLRTAAAKLSDILANRTLGVRRLKGAAAEKSGESPTPPA